MDTDDFAHHDYPVESFSWNILSDKIAVKKVDMSSFLHKGTGIPQDTTTFFNVSNFSPHDRKDVTLYYHGEAYDAYLQMDNFERIRLLWRQDFANELKSTFPDWFEMFSSDEKPTDSPPSMIFNKQDEQGTSYVVDFAHDVDIDLSIKGTTPIGTEVDLPPVIVPPPMLEMG